jgi:CDP-paratose 2-epimerase
LCEAITGKSTQIQAYLEERSGDIPIFITDSSKVMDKTGWRPTITPKATIQDIHEWIFNNEAILSAILS